MCVCEPQSQKNIIRNDMYLCMWHGNTISTISTHHSDGQHMHADRNRRNFNRHYRGGGNQLRVGGARQDCVFARNLRACIDNGLYVKDLRNVHEQP